jgi:hypothetical protein
VSIPGRDWSGKRRFGTFRVALFHGFGLKEQHIISLTINDGSGFIAVHQAFFIHFFSNPGGGDFVGKGYRHSMPALQGPGGV